jgi:hypothetical protein
MAARPRGNRKAAFAGRGRSAVLFALGGFLFLQAAFHVPLSRWWPQLQDPEYGGKLARLRARLAERPDGRPLILALGSSHVGMGVRPETLATNPGEEGPVLFNFGLNDGCPVVTLLCLRRLLAEGIRPDLILVETCPLQLYLEGVRTQLNASIQTVRLQHQDLAILNRYYAKPHEMRRDWRKFQSLPWFYHRDFLLSYVAPQWVPRSHRLSIRWRNVDGWGWQWVAGHTGPYAEDLARLEAVRQYFTAMYKGFTVSEAAGKALREIAEICGQEKIPLAYLRMPEAVVFQGWYPPEIPRQTDQFLDGISREYQVPVIDARNWVEENGFADGHHLNPAGAEAFTRRLYQEVVQPLERGRSFAVAP